MGSAWRAGRRPARAAWQRAQPTQGGSSRSSAREGARRGACCALCLGTQTSPPQKLDTSFMSILGWEGAGVGRGGAAGDWQPPLGGQSQSDLCAGQGMEAHSAPLRLSLPVRGSRNHAQTLMAGPPLQTTHQMPSQGTKARCCSSWRAK
jgi:hypothetical protein